MVLLKGPISPSCTQVLWFKRAFFVCGSVQSEGCRFQNVGLRVLPRLLFSCGKACSGPCCSFLLVLLASKEPSMASKQQVTLRSFLTEAQGQLSLAQLKQNCFQKEGSLSKQLKRSLISRWERTPPLGSAAFRLCAIGLLSSRSLGCLRPCPPYSRRAC